MIKFNYNQKSYNLKTTWNQDKTAIYVDFKEEDRIPIDIVKEALEETFNIEIVSYTDNLHARETDTHEPIKFIYY